MRRLTALAVVLLALAAAAAVSVPAASACSDAAHCYAISQQNDGGSPNIGLFAQVRANCMNGPTAARFMTHEIWAGTTNGQRWVETGIARGAQFLTGAPQFFWARQDPTLSPAFRSWGVGDAPYNDYPSFFLELIGSEWYIWPGGAGGAWQHTSAVTTAVGNLSAGAETNSSYTASYGSINSLEYRDPNGNWYYGLPGGGAVRNDPGMGFSWTAAPHSFRVSAGGISC